MIRWLKALSVRLTETLAAAGLQEISIQETQRVHPAAASAIVRAVKPGRSA